MRPTGHQTVHLKDLNFSARLSLGLDATPTWVSFKPGLDRAGEDLLGDFIEAYKAIKSSGSTPQNRPDVLRALSQIPGVYCPSLYIPEYESKTGPIVSINRVAEDVPATVKKQTYRGNTLARSTVVSEKMAWENIYMVEVRGVGQ